MVNLRDAFRVHPDAMGHVPPKEVTNNRVIALGMVSQHFPCLLVHI